MSINSRQVLEDLTRVLADIDELTKAAAAAPAGGSAAQDPQVDCKVAAIRARIDGVHQAITRALHQRVEAVDGYFRENTWKTVGAAAGFAFIAGLIIGGPSCGSKD
ncbi:MAG: hypothetical protein ABI885_00215 [Gammaproteobacteria bacterium]